MARAAAHRARGPWRSWIERPWGGRSPRNRCRAEGSHRRYVGPTSIPRRTSSTPAPVASHSAASSLTKLMRVARYALAAFLASSALSASTTKIGASRADRGSRAARRRLPWRPFGAAEDDPGWVQEVLDRATRCAGTRDWPGPAPTAAVAGRQAPRSASARAIRVVPTGTVLRSATTTWWLEGAPKRVEDSVDRG